ncbi:hypothetical protein [Bradyrhizobium ivorense]|uniref:hypothetical protein n=1 Tax=Bradyrhizobium ivorense TaxID=2511166 RepID=UPI001E36EC37|nr:hypothetical protein [Bradyrhizobium ivorense]
MSGWRPLARSPKFTDGITSEAIEESGVNVFNSATPFGTGRVRCRFESPLEDEDEPEAISSLKNPAQHRHTTNG